MQASTKNKHKKIQITLSLSQDKLLKLYLDPYHQPPSTRSFLEESSYLINSLYILIQYNFLSTSLFLLFYLCESSNYFVHIKLICFRTKYTAYCFPTLKTKQPISVLTPKCLIQRINFCCFFTFVWHMTLTRRCMDVETTSKR